VSPPTFIFPSNLKNENDDSSVSAYLDATREESGCSLMQAIRMLVNNLNAVRIRQRQKLVLRLYRDPVTHAAVMRAVVSEQEEAMSEFLTVEFIAGTMPPRGTLSPEAGDEITRFIVGTEWVLSHAAIAPLVARLEPDSVSCIT